MKPIGPQEPIDTPAADAVGNTPQRAWYRTPWFLGIVGVIVLVGIGGGVAYLTAAHKPEPVITKATPQPSPTPTPTPSLSALTGLPVSADAADRTITGVVIENHPDARPQSGLGQAGVVYEALAEGGITRFLAFYGDSHPQTLGPIRSLRTYFIDWALEFDAPVAHAGGNADALDLVGPLKMKDLDGLGIGAPTFYRTNDRYAPHNLYTSIDLLDAIEAKYNFVKTPDFVLSPRKADEPGNPTHPNVHIDYSYADYAVDYAYDTKTNDYARKMAGQPHVDRNTGNQIHVKNVVVEFMPTSYGYTRINEQTVIMKTVGTGRALVFRDGNVVEGTWSKDSHSSRTKLLDASGKDIPLDAGNTWYSIVPTDKSVSY